MKKTLKSFIAIILSAALLMQLSGCGLSGAAVVSALFSQPDIEQAARELLMRIEMSIA